MAAINFPSNPTNGQILTVGTNKYSYSSTYGTWDVVANVVTGTPGRFTISATAPSGASAGDGWLDSNTGQMFILYGTQWLEVGPNLMGPAGEANFNSFMMMGA